ncbi:MAG: radical SAM protein [Rhodospirillales bacterium]|jgi:MoaA/NifB/PqqE/SkfB family radical SAM enzyme|nr:radical SAM protein [Rhodospirillales bacterium]
MLGQLRARFHDWFYRPRLDWIQVEINTQCNARCIYCPAAKPGREWPPKKMPLEIFETILPKLAMSASPSHWREPIIHLQGWGEPFLNPDFFAMAEATKRAGCAVGTTTNATLVDEAIAARIVDTGIDVISFSVAGIDERNDPIRPGTSLEQVLGAIAMLQRIKADRSSATPAIHIAYMLLKSGIDDIEQIPDLFAGRGIEQIVISTLTVIADPAVRHEVIEPATPAEFQILEHRLARAAEHAKERGIELHYDIPHNRHSWPGRPPGLCAENISRAIVVTVDGEVTPCMLNRFRAEDDPRPNPNPFHFGKLAEQSLADIWWSDGYLRFRRTFWDAEPPARCRACQKLG